MAGRASRQADGPFLSGHCKGKATSRREHPVLLARARVHMRVREALPGASRAQVIGVDVRRTTRVKRESGSYRILNYRMLKLLETVD